MHLVLTLLLSLAAFTVANIHIHDLSQPVTSDEVVPTGGKLILKCTVEEHDDSSLQWSNPAQQTLYFGEKRALRDNRIQLVHSSRNELTISISNVQLSDEGEYTCAIFTMPVRISKAMVTVLGVPQKPQIFGYEKAFKENEKAKLRCTTSGSKPAANIRWYKGPEELEGAQTSTSEDGNGKTFTVMSIIEFMVGREDDGIEITCTVGLESLQSTDKSSSHKIQVLYKPTARIESRPQMPREGDKLRLQCDAYGNPVPDQYIWERENGELPSLAMYDGSSLVFPFLNKSDGGTYICKASNMMGTYVTQYKLDVNDANFPDPSPIPSTSSIDHAVIGGVVAVIAFLLFCLLIVLGRYLIRHKGTYLTHEAKGSDDAPDADTAIINAEGGQGGSDDKKEYFI
ncbi:cell adhesion molecule 3 isoform X1 [Pelobates fuscus]|uniref:cell adhesion molecule 3 isoform X1 n=1 Tax=Pelobates fuscus TaxID=191477 RepID=UPI002FE48589